MIIKDCVKQDLYYLVVFWGVNGDRIAVVLSIGVLIARCRDTIYSFVSEVQLLVANWGHFVPSFIQKRVVGTTFDIYVFITITGSIPLLVDYYSPKVSSISQRFGTDMLYYIYLLLKLQFLNKVIRVKTKVLLHQA